MAERWRDVPGYDGRYQASTEGRIRQRMPGGEHRALCVIYNQGASRNQQVVNLYRPDGRRVTDTVLRLVAKTYYGPIKPGQMVVHRNGLHDDNRVENVLILHCTQNGRRFGGRGRRKCVLMVDSDGEPIEAFASVTAASQATGISRMTIRRHCEGERVYALPEGVSFRWDRKYAYTETD